VRSYTRSVSTTWEWRKVKIQPAARPTGKSALGRRQATVAPSFDRRYRTVQVKYRGGPEAWWELATCGYSVRIPGHICLHDALSFLLENNGPEGRR
jgi:hypothetical protein